MQTLRARETVTGQERLAHERAEKTEHRRAEQEKSAAGGNESSRRRTLYLAAVPAEAIPADAALEQSESSEPRVRVRDDDELHNNDGAEAACLPAKTEGGSEKRKLPSTGDCALRLGAST
jgi:hypothetical protein